MIRTCVQDFREILRFLRFAKVFPQNFATIFSRFGRSPLSLAGLKFQDVILGKRQGNRAIALFFGTTSISRFGGKIFGKRFPM